MRGKGVLVDSVVAVGTNDHVKQMTGGLCVDLCGCALVVNDAIPGAWGKFAGIAQRHELRVRHLRLNRRDFATASAIPHQVHVACKRIVFEIIAHNQ